MPVVREPVGEVVPVVLVLALELLVVAPMVVDPALVVPAAGLVVPTGAGCAAAVAVIAATAPARITVRFIDMAYSELLPFSFERVHVGKAHQFVHFRERQQCRRCIGR